MYSFSSVDGVDEDRVGERNLAGERLIDRIRTGIGD